MVQGDTRCVYNDVVDVSQAWIHDQLIIVFACLVGADSTFIYTR